MNTSTPIPLHDQCGPLDASIIASLKGIRHVALDMDGTIYCGSHLFPFTQSFLKSLDELGITYSFLTNNSSKSANAYLSKLSEMGLEVPLHQLYTSTHATLQYLKDSQPQLRKLFVVGTASMIEEVIAAGYEVVTGEQEPEAVLVAFDLDPSYTHLCKAAYWIKAGKPFIATHPDYVCPTNEATILIDCGAVCAMLEAATGIKPMAVLGKPEPAMLWTLAKQLHLEPQQIAMVGDRIYTDVAMAQRAGALGVLVLSGEATMQDVEISEKAPDLVLTNTTELAQLLASV